jgi:hypothetical protein
MTSARRENKSEPTSAVGRPFQAVNIIVVFVIIDLAISQSVRETGVGGARIIWCSRFWQAVSLQGM